MKKTKRIFAVLLALVMCVLTFATTGCDKECEHTFGDWIGLDNEGKFCEQRVYHQVCQSCGEIKTKNGSEDDHQFGQPITVEPTCEQDGYDQTTCSVCAKSVRSNEVEASGHSWSEEFSYDGLNHWYDCENCESVDSNQPHQLDEDGICLGCNKALVSSEGIVYELSADQTYYTVVGFQGGARNTIIIADEYEGKPVKSIGESAFMGEYMLKVIIPSSITHIGDGAFRGCSSLTEIRIPSSVTTMGDNAFYGCTALNNLTIENGLTAIPTYAFYNCTSLTQVELPNSVTSVGNYAFYFCTSLVEVTNGNGITSIGDNAFTYCNQLTTVEVGENIQSISETAFDDCGSLQYNQYNNGCYLGNSLSPYVVLMTTTSKDITSFQFSVATKLIYTDAFANCNQLSGVDLPSGLTLLPKNAFYNCDGLTDVQIPDGVTTIADNAFGDCDNIESVVIPDGVTYIGNNAFQSCDKLANVEISQDVAYIGDNAFTYTALTSVTIPSGVTVINPRVFYQCSQLSSVVFLGAITSIASGAFYGTKLTSVQILSSVTSIGQTAFYGSALTQVNIPQSVTSIGSQAFANCDDLTQFVVDQANTQYTAIDGNLYTKDGQTILQYAAGKSATSFAIAQSVTKIGVGAFEGSDNLQKITLGDNVSVFEQSAFDDCANLAYNQYDNAYYLGSATNDYKLLVAAVSKDVASCAINSKTEYVYDSAFSSCSNLAWVVVGSAVKSVANNAFNSCKNLESVLYEGTQSEWNNAALSSNSVLRSVNVYYYSETEPKLNALGNAYDGNYWRYVGGEAVIWEAKQQEIEEDLSIVSNVTVDEFQLILGTHDKVLLYFWADWCAACDGTATEVEKFAQLGLGIKVVKMDIGAADQQPPERYFFFEYTEMFGNFNTIPYVVYFVDGQPVAGKHSSVLAITCQQLQDLTKGF